MKKSSAICLIIIMFLTLGGLTYSSIEGIGYDSVGAAKNIKLGLDLAGGVSITYQVAGEQEPSAEDMDDTVYKLQQRVSGYSTESQVYKEGKNRITIEIPGVSDAASILEDLGKPGSLYFIAQTAPDGSANYQLGSYGYELVSTKTIDDLILDGGSIVLQGAQITGAVAQNNTNDLGNTEPVVSIKVDADGTKSFADATQKAFKNGESIGIYYDGQFISVPTVSAVITDGQAIINGMSSFDEASKLAQTIRIGGLKLELEELRSNVVGAQLGSQAISTSLMAGAIGLAALALLLIALYFISGLASTLALSIYIGMTVFLIYAFELTLTLPGIAGILLSIGMAIDANVIIFARIREELRSGSNVKQAFETGFSKSLSAIIDGNITTLIVAIVLGIMGTGPVKGFAQTLALGVILSVFSALVLSKIIIKALISLGIGAKALFGSSREPKTFDFVKNGKIFVGVSVVLILAGFAFMGVNKAQIGSIYNYSLEFVGGTSSNVTFNEDLSLERLDAEVKPIIAEVTGNSEVTFQKVEDSFAVIIKTRPMEEAQRLEIYDRLAADFGIDAATITYESISSTISSEMTRDAILALAVSLACMLIYIWFRFADLRFAGAAVIALVNDSLLVVAFYAVSRIVVSNTFIACLLTVVGYSINSNIVVFDRLREHLREKKSSSQTDFAKLVNVSVSQTLGRNIVTTLTTLFMVLSLCIWGVSSIREFSWPLFVGILSGGYSSICVSGAIWYLFKTRVGKKKRKK